MEEVGIDFDFSGQYFSKYALQPDKDYNFEGHDLSGAVGITYDPVHCVPVHLFLRVMQGVARTFNRRWRQTDKNLMHGWAVLKSHGDPHDAKWVIAHHTWAGGITSLRTVNNHTADDEGARLWLPNDPEVKQWFIRAIDYVCAPQQRREDDVRPVGWRRSKFATFRGAAIPFHPPQYRKAPRWHFRRIARAVADLWLEQQFMTWNGRRPEKFTCVSLVTLSLQSAIAIRLLTREQKAEMSQIKERRALADRVYSWLREEGSPVNYFLTRDSIGLQNSRYPWPAVLGRALDAHSELVDTEALEVLHAVGDLESEEREALPHHISYQSAQ